MKNMNVTLHSKWCWRAEKRTLRTNFKCVNFNIERGGKVLMALNNTSYFILSTALRITIQLLYCYQSHHGDETHQMKCISWNQRANPSLFLTQETTTTNTRYQPLNIKTSLRVADLNIFPCASFNPKIGKIYWNLNGNIFKSISYIILNMCRCDIGISNMWPIFYIMSRFDFSWTMFLGFASFAVPLNWLVVAFFSLHFPSFSRVSKILFRFYSLCVSFCVPLFNICDSIRVGRMCFSLPLFLSSFSLSNVICMVYVCLIRYPSI